MTILDLIIAHPGIAFFMSWPVVAILVAFSLHITQSITNLMQFALNVTTAVVLLFRGYPPADPVVPPTEDNP